MEPAKLLLIPRNTLRSESAILLVASVLVGLAAGFAGLLLHDAIEWAMSAFFWPFGVEGGEKAASGLPWYGLLLLPVAGGLALMPILRWLAPEVRGGGITEVIESLAVRGGRMRRRAPFVKIATTAISLGAGASAGREGPIVFIGGAIGSFFSRVLRASVRQTRTLVACGAGAGIAATFNMPFAGAIFAVEVILGDFQAAKLGPIVVSCVVATVVSHIFLGDAPAIMHVEFAMHSPWELLLYALLGVVIGLLAVAQIRGVMFSAKLLARLPVKSWWYPAIGGLAVGVLALTTPHRFGVGYYQVNEIIGRETALLLGATLAITAVKLVATSISLGSGFSGGIFAPALLIGTMAGSAFGLVAARFFDVSHPSNYALVGMGALLAGVMHAPISAVLMIFEITRHPMVILPLMVATVISSLISALLQPDDIHHWSLSARGVKLDRHRHADPLRGRQVSELVRREAPEVPHDMPLGQVIARLLEQGSNRGFVVDADGRLTGIIHGNDLAFALTERDALDGLVVAADLAQPVREAARPDDDLAVALKLLDRAREEEIPVIDGQGRRLGEISRADVFAVFHEELDAQDLQHTMVDAISLSERLGEIDLGDGHVLVELEVPPHAYGKTLPELDIRRRFHIQVVMLRRRLPGGEGRGAWKRWAPTPSDTLEPGDFLLVLGERENIRNATKI